MKREFALKVLSISLFLFAFSANSETNSDQINACNQAINKADATTALKLANAMLKSDEISYGALLCKGRALGLQGKYAEALTMHESATKNANTSFDKIIAYMLTGNLHKSNQEIDAAIASYQLGLVLCESDHNQQYSRISHNLIGDAHMQQKQLNDAVISYLAGAKLANNDNERADSYERVAGTYEKLAQYDAAIEYQVKTVVMQQKAGSLDAYANANLVLGKMFFKAKEYNHAEKTFKKLEKFSIDNGGAYYEAKANLYLAETKAARNDHEAAKNLIAHARSLSKKIGATDLMNEIDRVEKKLIH
jgi:tetratricopeptide (TPR) repeat protein